MRFTHIITLFFMLIASPFVHAQSGNVYSNGQSYGTVQDGTVIQARQVESIKPVNVIALSGWPSAVRLAHC